MASSAAAHRKKERRKKEEDTQHTTFDVDANLIYSDDIIIIEIKSIIIEI